MNQFPNVCSRCGFCCLVEVCPNGMLAFNVKYKYQECPGLEIDEKTGEATCTCFIDSMKWGIPESTAKEMFGIGKGCCIGLQACVIANGKSYQFAPLPVEAKKMAVEQIRSNKGTVLRKR